MNKVEQDTLNARILRKMRLISWDNSQGVHLQLTERAQDTDPIFDLFADSPQGAWSREKFVVWLGFSYDYYLHHFCGGWDVLDEYDNMVNGKPDLSYQKAVINVAQYIAK